MKQVFLFLFVLLTFDRLQAQQVYFITIDAENKQPFSAIVGARTIKSSATGHLIIPNLSDSTYQLAIHFPMSSYPDQIFTIAINKKDKGYLLKKSTEKGWGLFDWQTMELIKPRVTESNFGGNENNSIDKSKDAFARMMAAVVNDSEVLFTASKTGIARNSKENKADKQVGADSIKQGEVGGSVKQSESQKIAVTSSAKSQDDLLVKTGKTETLKNTGDNKPEKQLGEGNNKSVVVAVTDQNDIIHASDTANSKKNAVDSLVKSDELVKSKPVEGVPVADSNKVKKSIIIPLGERWTKELRELVFVDSSEGLKPDTIKVLIAIEEVIYTERKLIPDSASEKAKPILTENEGMSIKIVPPGLAVETRKPDTATTSAPVVKIPDSVIVNKGTAPPKKLVIINSDCRNFATETDVDKLRIKMLAESNVDERIVLARKVFRTKCFTTKQIKALTELFVNDKTRYNFFDTAYPFVSDSENFKGLVEMLTDEYYISRFKVMVRM